MLDDRQMQSNMRSGMPTSRRVASVSSLFHLLSFMPSRVKRHCDKIRLRGTEGELMHRDVGFWRKGVWLVCQVMGVRYRVAVYIYV